MEYPCLYCRHHSHKDSISTAGWRANVQSKKNHYNSNWTLKIWSQRHDKGEVINRIRSTQVLFITSPRRNVSFEPCDILVVRRTQINWITDFNTTTEYFPSSECLLVHSFFIISPFFFFGFLCLLHQRGSFSFAGYSICSAVIWGEQLERTMALPVLVQQTADASVP